MKKRPWLILLVLLFSSITQADTPQPTTRPIPAIHKVMVVSIDGLRPDLALLADTPTIHSLLKQGSYTMWARTTEVSITLPSHVSMMTGVTPAKHGVDWNHELPAGRDAYPKVPTLFDLATPHGYTCGMAAGKSKFAVFCRPGGLEWSFIPADSTTEDDQVAKNAVEMIKDHRPDVMFVHFPGCDNAGHAKGWGSPEQMAAIHGADTSLGQVLAAAKEAGTLDETLVIVTADHGGAGLGHGPNDPRSRHIPWIAVGPGVRTGYDLTRVSGLNINTEDTFATASFVLGLPIANDIDGKPIQAMFEQPGQLLTGNAR